MATCESHLRILVFLPLLMGAQLFAQIPPDSVSSRGFGLKLGWDQLKEENLHAKVHGGAAIGLNYRWRSRPAKARTFEASLRFGRLKTGYEPLAATAHVNIDLTYSRSFNSYRIGSWTAQTGPVAQLAYDISYYPNWDDSHLYWADHLDVGIQHSLGSACPNDRYVEVQMRLSLLSLASRPERDRFYKIDDLSAGGILGSLHTHIAFGTLDRVLDLGFRMTYRLPLSKRYSQTVLYDFQYRRLAIGDAARYQSATHSIGLTWDVL